MSELTDAEIDAASARGKAALLAEPRAASARYDRARARVVVELANGCTFAFPPWLAQGLGSATDDQLEQVEVLGSGTGLHWETLDVDLSVPDLLAGLFGTKAYMARRLAEGKSKREVIRVLKRYVAREIYRYLPRA